MKGYIYTMFEGADPGLGWEMTDPILTRKPTFGACMPNIRRAVDIGDYIFSISGRMKNVQQYIVGGFEVEEKINALAAYDRFPEYRMHRDGDKTLKGNIIVDEHGEHLDIDYHNNFEKRIENYIVGTNPLFLSDKDRIQKAREGTVEILNYLFNKKEDKIHKIIGRHRRMDEYQINDLLSWFKNL